MIYIVNKEYYGCFFGYVIRVRDEIIYVKCRVRWIVI